MNFEGASMVQLLWAVDLSSWFGWLLSGPIQTLGVIELTHVYMIFSGDLDNATPSDKDNEPIRHSNNFGKQKWLVYHIMQQIQVNVTYLYYSCLLFILKMVIMKLSSPGSKLMLIFLLILVCVILVWGHCNVDSDLSQNYGKPRV